MINKPREYFQRLKYGELISAVEFIKIKLKNELIKAFNLQVVSLPTYVNRTKDKFQAKDGQRNINFDSANVDGLNVRINGQNRIIRSYLEKIKAKVGMGIFSIFDRVDRDAVMNNVSTMLTSFYNVDIIVDENKIGQELTFKITDKLFIILSQIQQQVNKQFGTKNAWSPEYSVESWNKFSNRYKMMNKTQKEQTIAETHDIVLVSDFKSANKFELIEADISPTEVVWESLVRCIGNIGSSGFIGQLFEVYISPTKQQFEEQVNVFENKHLLLDASNETYLAKNSFVSVSVRINLDLVVMKMLGIWHIAEISPIELDSESDKVFKQFNVIPYF